MRIGLWTALGPLEHSSARHNGHRLLSSKRSSSNRQGSSRAVVSSLVPVQSRKRIQEVVEWVGFIGREPDPASPFRSYSMHLSISLES